MDDTPQRTRRAESSYEVSEKTPNELPQFSSFPSLQIAERAVSLDVARTASSRGLARCRPSCLISFVPASPQRPRRAGSTSSTVRLIRLTGLASPKVSLTAALSHHHGTPCLACLTVLRGGAIHRLQTSDDVWSEMIVSGNNTKDYPLA